MQLTKKEILKALVFKEDSDEFIIFELPLTQEQRTKAQNNAFYRLFSEIGKKLWHNTEETKQALLKWVFGTKKIKMWWMEFEIAIKWSTKELNKQEAILLIERWNEFGKKIWCWEIITSIAMNTLFLNEKNES